MKNIASKLAIDTQPIKLTHSLIFGSIRLKDLHVSEFQPNQQLVNKIGRFIHLSSFINICTAKYCDGVSKSPS